MSRISAPFSLAVAFFIALVPLAAAGLIASPASAAKGDVTWSVEPVATTDGARRTFDYSVDPGTQIRDSVVVTNQGTTAAEFLIYATDARNELETGAFGLLRREETPVDAGAWITMETASITIQPGSQATVPFNLLVPSDAIPGDHVAGIVASVITSGEQDGAAVALEQRVGARVYLTVSGVPDVGVETSGFISTFTPELNPFAPGRVNVTYDVRNSGNVRMDVTQRIDVTGPFGIPLGSITPDSIVNILPRQTVRVTADVPAITALALTWSNLTLVPSPVGGADQDAEPVPIEPAADAAVTDTVVDTEAAPEFVPVSSSALAVSVSWTMLALVVGLLALVYLVYRYVAGTRERFYAAIDEASANRDAELAERS